MHDNDLLNRSTGCTKHTRLSSIPTVPLAMQCRRWPNFSKYQYWIDKYRITKRAKIYVMFSYFRSYCTTVNAILFNCPFNYHAIKCI